MLATRCSRSSPRVCRQRSTGPGRSRASVATKFAVLILGHGCDDAIYDALVKIKSALAEPMNLGGALRSCSASVGLTLYPRDATDQSELLKNADLALYRAKSIGRGRTDVFSPELRASIDRKVELQENALEAIQRDEFVLFFQPVVPSDPTQPVSFEALLRWRHPVHGLLAPGRFEEIFEDASVAVALGDRVMDLAITQAAAWQADGLAFGRVAFNVTGADFAFGSLADRIKAKLDRHGVSPSKMCVEVTERVFLGSGSTHVVEALEQLDASGVEVALDDFGTGYASLCAYQGVSDRAAESRSLVRHGHARQQGQSVDRASDCSARKSLGLCTTAEGVENEAQVHAAAQHGMR